MNPTFGAGAPDLAELLAVHLHDEEAALAAGLPMVRALKSAMTQSAGDRLAEIADGHQAIAGLFADIKMRRQRFLEQMSRRCQLEARSLTVSLVINTLPTSKRAALHAAAEEVRTLAQEFVAVARWVTVHLRIHLDAYQRLLCDLTGTANHSGRYGPAGKAETSDFRPIIQIQG